jgi:hypothetical protein
MLCAWCMVVGYYLIGFVCVVNVVYRLSASNVCGCCAVGVGVCFWLFCHRRGFLWFNVVP